VIRYAFSIERNRPTLFVPLWSCFFPFNTEFRITTIDLSMKLEKDRPIKHVWSIYSETYGKFPLCMQSNFILKLVVNNWKCVPSSEWIHPSRTAPVASIFVTKTSGVCPPSLHSVTWFVNVLFPVSVMMTSGVCPPFLKFRHVTGKDYVSDVRSRTASKHSFPSWVVP